MLGAIARKPACSVVSNNMRGTINTNLNEALRQYRSEQAYVRAVSHVSVFSDSLLRRIIASKPCTLTALSKLNGIGQVRRKHYGKDIVRLVNLEMKSNKAKNQRHQQTTPTARGARNTKRNALKGKPQAKNRKAVATINKSSSKSIGSSHPVVSNLNPSNLNPINLNPINLNPVNLSAHKLFDLSPINLSAQTVNACNDPVVLSRFFPVPPETNKVDKVIQEIKPVKAIKPTLKKVKPIKTSVYILELEDGRVYVGSSKDVPRRLAQHLSGSGSAYTRIYKPTGVMLPRLGNVEGDGDAAERDETLRYMMLRGVPFVRGWKFARVDMPPEEYDEAEANIRELFDLCRKCGYKGHFCTHCKATFDRLGNPVNK